MSDQETKPVEAVEAEVQVTPADTPAETSIPASNDHDAEAPKGDEEKVKEGDAKTRPSSQQPPEGMLRTSGRRNADDKVFSNNVKFDPSVLPTTDDPKQIRTQV